MSSRMHSKPGRGWERGSSGSRRYPGGERGPSPPKEHFRRRDIGVSPERSKRGKWESSSPSKKNHIIGSPSRISQRRGFDIPPRSSFGREASSPKTRSSFFNGDEFRVNSSRQEGRREGPGLVFLCNSSTMRDCFHFRVLGLPIAQQDIVKRVVPGTKLFLFNVELKELYGVFEAASHGGVNLVPEAFQGSREAYTAQVRFSIFRDCLPLADHKTRDVLKDNFSLKGKFDCQLSANQVDRIIELFSQTESRLPQQHMERPSLEGVYMPTSYLHENLFPESHLLINKSLADAVRADPGAVLAHGVIDEVDQLAFKYLQNDPGYAAIRLDPVNTSLLSTSSRKRSMDQNFPGSNLHPQFGSFPDSRISLTDKNEKDNNLNNDGGRTLNEGLSSSNSNERGLLRHPGMPPHQLSGGMYNGPVPGPISGSGGDPLIPFHGMQGHPHMIRPPPISMNMNQTLIENNQRRGKNLSNHIHLSNRHGGNRHQGKSMKNKPKFPPTEKGAKNDDGTKDKSGAEPSSVS